MPRQLFTPTSWTGGFYELAIELVEQSDERLLTALRALWSHPALDGCYLDRSREPSDQPRVAVDLASLTEGHVHGIATVDSATPIACGSVVIREAPEDGGSDWMVFYLPLGALGEIRPVGGYPFDGADHEGWRVPLDSWLADLGRAIWKSIPFDLGLIGFEASGELRAAQVLESGAPGSRHFGLLMRGADGTLEYHPRTERD